MPSTLRADRRAAPSRRVARTPAARAPAAASASGSVACTIGRTSPAATSGQTCSRRPRRSRPCPRPGASAAWSRSPRRACASAPRGRARPWCRPACRSRPAAPRVASTSTLRARYFAPMLSRIDVGAVTVALAADDVDEVLVAVVDRDVGAELGAQRALLRRPGGRVDPRPRARGPSWIAIVPMPPAPPWTSRCSRGRSPATMKTFDQTVQATSGSAAAVTRSIPAGHRHQLPGRHGHLLGVPAAGEQRAHLVADGPARDARRRAPRRCRCTRGR